MTPAPCIICGQPRSPASALWCADPACRAAVNAKPADELRAIREREAVEAMRSAVGTIHVHVRERE